MSLDLEELRADLIERWRAAFGRIAEISAEVSPVAETVFSEYPAFELSKYTPQHFPAGAQLFRVAGPYGRGYVFDLDARGRPIRIGYSDDDGRVTWNGFYRYGPHEVEHIEFYLPMRVPSFYNRVLLSESNVIAEQRMNCNNGAGSPHLERLGSAAKADRLLADQLSYHLYLVKYHLEAGAPRFGEEYLEGAGGVHRPTLHYSYEGDVLMRIVQHWPSGEQRTVFAAKSAMTLPELSASLATQIAQAALAALVAARLRLPLVAVEMTYRWCDGHIPTLIPATTGDRSSGPELAAQIESNRWIVLEESDFAPAIIDFNQRTQDDADAVAAMLRKAARLVTERAPGRLQVADGFVAYAVDWETERQPLQRILAECGATDATITEWTRRGWI